MAGNIKDDSFGNSNNIIIINTIKARKISPSVTPPPSQRRALRLLLSPSIVVKS